MTKIMSMKEIDIENATKSNATRGNAYTIYTTQIHTNKYIEHVNQQTTNLRKNGIDNDSNLTSPVQSSRYSQKNSREFKTPNVPLQEPS